MAKLALKEGEAFVEGRNADTAKRLIKAAEDAGLETSVVRTTSFGYIVPAELGEGDTEYGKMSAADGNTKDTPAGTGTEEPKVTGDLSGGTDSGDDNPDENQGGEDLYDPADHKVEEVQEYLATADEAERERVLEAERNGKARTTLLSDTEGAK